MKKTTLVITVLISFPLFSQVPLTTTNNTLRHGDLLFKIEVPYVEQVGFGFLGCAKVAN